MTGPGAYCFGDEERAEVLDVLSSGHLSRYGSLDDPGFKHKVWTLEQEFARLCGVDHAVATSSGTGSILISLLALGIGAGDEVLVPGFTYVATIGSVIHARATPVLCEIDSSLNLDPEDVRRKITPRTKAILVVHMLGNPADMRELVKIAEEHDLAIVEDVCQAGGGSFEGQRLGTFGAFGAFSLNRYKMFTAGDGGLIVTNDKGLYERAFALHDQGHIPLRETKEMNERSVIGLNFKMNELTGAVALAQVRKLDWMLETLRAKKRQLRELLPELPGMTYRKLNDPDGDCATILTVTFDDPARATSVAKALGSRTLDSSGWHVYNLMDQIVGHKTPAPEWSEPARFAQPGDLPQTDDLLRRSVNISVGVVDSGIGASFGVNIRSTEEEVAAVAARFAEAARASVAAA